MNIGKKPRETNDNINEELISRRAKGILCDGRASNQYGRRVLSSWASRGPPLPDPAILKAKDDLHNIMPSSLHALFPSIHSADHHQINSPKHKTESIL